MAIKRRLFRILHRYSRIAVGTTGLVLASCSHPVLAQAPERPPAAGTPATIPLMKKQIKPGVFLITGRGGNAIVLTTSEGPVLIDSKVMRESVRSELLAIIATIDPRPIQLAFVTHHHADHAGGTYWLRESEIPVVGHSNLIDILQSYRSTIAPRNPSPPSIVFDREYRATVGDVQFEAYYWGPAHTNADIAIFLPQSRIVVAGDLIVTDGEPDLDILDGHGSLFGMQQRLDDLLSLDFELAIPGHGENAMTRPEVILYKSRIDELIRRGQAAVREGVRLEGLLEAMRSEDLGLRLVGHFWTDPVRLARIYEELEREAESTAVSRQ